MGFVYLPFPENHPQRWRAQRCPTCGEGRQAEYLAKYCILPADLQGISLKTSRRIPDQSGAIAAAMEALKVPAYFFSVFGAPGTGKTHILAGMVNDARRDGRTAYYTTMTNILDHLKRAYDPKITVTDDQYWDKLVATTVLAIDECDRWNPTPWAQERFFTLIDERWRNGQNRLTVFASNNDASVFPEYMQSRLLAQRSKSFTLSGFDLRKVI